MARNTIRYESAARIMGIPFVAVAMGQRGQERGVARGIVAIGDIAQGVVAIGGVATGGIAVGGIAVGLFALGGVALGALTVGGVALGYGAFGGVAIGYNARGGAVVGRHVMSPKRTDPEAAEFFRWVMPGTVDDDDSVEKHE